ncbi:MAG TPA: helical backbone metal receptor [Patescibacteria group bacterium]|nr:helical backbone metal receptor [Patescibacteria group bacterium]
MALLLGTLTLGRCTPPASPAGEAVRDGLGREVHVPAAPRRLVSLAPNVTETIVALGLTDRLVGVSDFCTLPPGATGVRRVGGLLTPDLEVIRSLHPDLLIGTTSGNDPGLGAQAEALGLPLYILQARTVDEVVLGIEALAAVLGEPERGRALALSLRSRLQAVEQRSSGRARPRVLFIIWSEPLVVPGSGAFLTDAIQKAGGESVTAGVAAAHQSYSIESAVALAPEVILTTRDNGSLPDRILGDPVWAAVPAVKSRRVYLVGDAIVRPGPGVVDGIEEIAGRLHPEGRPSEQPTPP